MGAVFRNGFLYATSLVYVSKSLSLFDVICKCPLDSSHPLYRHYIGGFPKPFIIDCRTISKGQTGKVFRLKAGKTYNFSLHIFGTHCKYKDSYIEAVRIFLERGIGTPKVAMTFDGVKTTVPEISSFSNFHCFKRLIKNEGIATIDLNKKEMEVCFFFITPVSLFQHENINFSENAFQDKMNGFPSFYQIIRSLFYRLVSLEILYGTEMHDLSVNEIDDFINSNLGTAVRAVLTDVRIRKYSVISTRKKNTDFVYKMSGYIGSISFSNVSSMYLPLIEWGEFAGIGNDISYGLGLYRTEIKNI